jgi:hypothetical protein
MGFGEFVNSELGLLLIGFLLTTVAGGLITVIFQREAWKRQTRVNLHQKLYDDGVVFLDELSELIGERYFAIQRWLWALGEPESYDLGDVETAYFAIVAIWNKRLRLNRNKLRLLIDEEHASLFLDYSDDGRGDNPRSLHYQFVQAHNAVAAVKKGNKPISEAERYLNILNHSCSNYLEQVTTLFLKRASELKLLVVESK